MAGTPYRLVAEYESQDDRRDVARLLGILRREWGAEETAEIVLRALREAAAKT